MMALKVAEYKGDSFGGRTHEVDRSHIPEFWMQNRDRFGKGGVETFTRTLGIPSSFFRQQSVQLQDDIVRAQAVKIEKAPSLFVLEKNESIAAVSRSTELGWESPDKTICAEGPWYYQQEDVFNLRYRYGETPNDSQYHFCVFSTFPFYYAGQIEIQFGFYKLVCTNGMVHAAKEMRGGFRFPLLNTNRTKIQGVVRAMLTAMAEEGKTYEDGFNQLRSTPVSTGNIGALLSPFVGKLPKTVLDKTLSHFELTVQNTKSDLPAESPTNITNTYELMDTMTYYSRRLPSMGSQIKSEKAIFDGFLSKGTTPKAVTKIVKEFGKDANKAPSPAAVL